MARAGTPGVEAETAIPSAPTPALPPLWLLIALAGIGPFALNIVLPAIPAMARSYDSSYGVLQLILTLYLTAFAIAQLILGPLSDRLGRRPVMLASLGLLVVGSVWCALAPSPGWLLAGRVVQAMGGSTGLALGRTIVRDVQSTEQAASTLGYITMGMVVAPMLAPAVGGLLVSHGGWPLAFWLVGAAGLGLLWLCGHYLTETAPAYRSAAAAPTPPPKVSAFGYGPLLGITRFWGYALTMAFASGMFFGFLAGAPYVVGEIMGRPEGEYGFYFILSSLGYMLGNFLSGRFAKAVGPDTMVALGVALSLVGVALLWGLAHWLHPLALFLPMTVIAISNGMNLPSATAKLIGLRPGLAGAASGFGGAFQIGVGALVTLVVGALISGGSQWLLWVMSVCGGLSLLGAAIALWGPKDAP